MPPSSGSPLPAPSRSEEELVVVEADDAGKQRLSALETEVIDLFVSAVRLLGIPKSIGEIYGLLFISPSPLTLDALVEKLQISKGSASQGMKFLRQVGAVQAVYVAGERRDHFEPVTQLKVLAAGFIRGELLPHLESGENRLKRLTDLATDADATGCDDGTPEFYTSQVQQLEKWHQRTRKVLPLIERILD